MGFFENRRKNKLIKFVNSRNCDESVKNEAISKINDGIFTAQYQISRFLEKSRKKASKPIVKDDTSKQGKSSAEPSKPKFLFSRELTADEYGELILENALMGNRRKADQLFVEASAKYPEKKDIYFLCLAMCKK